MKRIAFLSTFAFALVATALWISQKYVSQWEPRLRSQIEKQLGASLHARIHIGDISISFIHRATLKDVAVWDTRQDPETLIFRAKEVTLIASLIDLPRALYHRNPIEIVGLVSLEEPLLILSPAVMHRRGGSRAAVAKPPWFSLEWNGGTIQWRDDRLPRGVATLYRSKGFFRIRGPHMEAAIEGGLEQAKSINGRFSILGRRWTAQGNLAGASLAGFIRYGEQLTQKPLIPQGWKARGRMNLTAKAGGRWPISASQDPGGMIKEARLTFSNASLEVPPNAATIHINGGLLLKRSRLDFSDLSLRTGSNAVRFSGQAQLFAKPVQMDIQASSPRLDLAELARTFVSPSAAPMMDGIGALNVTIKGNLPHTEASVLLSVPQGHLWRWPFSQARIQADYASEGWTFGPSSLQLCGGTLTFKGTAGKNQLDLQTTGNEMSLAALLPPSLNHAPLKGRLNFSLATRGALKNLRTAGSFWINDFAWVSPYSEPLRGDIDLAAAHFKLQGASESGDMRLRIEGTRSEQAWTLQHFLLKLREETLLNARGVYSMKDARLQGRIEAKNISLAEDIPSVHEKIPSLKGRVNLEGELEGNLPHPVFKAQLISEDFQIGTSSPSSLTAALRWSPKELTVDANASFKGFPVTRGGLRFNLHDRGVDVLHFSLASPQGKTEFKGRGVWEAAPAGSAVPNIIYLNGEGRISSLSDTSVWNIPYHLKGQVHPANKWSGEVNFQAPSVRLFKKDKEPFQARLRWDEKEVRWNDLRWGSLSSNGALRLDGQPSQLSGQVLADNADLASWQALFWPQMKKPLQGKFTGTLALAGSLQDPELRFSGKLNNGSWRAFEFESAIEGAWKKESLEPLALEGSFRTGGQFNFRGRVSPADETASGSLDLIQVNLKPLGQSLSFPHPLTGSANGTFTVSGPLQQLHFAGHLEGRSLAYGEPNPIRLESCVMDLKVEPLAEKAGITRLIISQAVAKTKEEEIRINPGSFIDFSPIEHQARMQIGTEIRNLHLGVFTLFGGLDINGTWDIRPLGFALQGELFTRSLFINDYQLEQGSVQAFYYNGLLSFQPPRGAPALVTGTIDFQKAPQLTFKDFALSGKERQSLQLSGNVGPHLWNFTMVGQGLDIGTLGGLAGFPYSLAGKANLKVRGAGDLEHPDVQGTVEIEDGNVLGLNFRNGQADFAWQGERMTFTRLQLSDPGRYTLSGTGVFPLANAKKATKDKTIDFSVRLVNSNLGMLRSFSSEVRRAEGAVQALVQIKGTSDKPTVRGSIRVKNGDIEGAHYFRRVSDLQLAIDFDGNQLVLTELRGKSGKGVFTGGGQVTFSGFEPTFYDLHLDIPSVKGIEVTVPELAIPESPLAKKLKFLFSASQCDVRGRATFRGPAEAPVFEGKTYLSNGHFTFPPSVRRPPPPAFLEWVRRITWNIDLRFADGAWFENELVEANLIGALTINGPADRLKVDGGMDITEGRISYLGVEFDIRQGRFDIRTTDNGSKLVTTPYVRGIAESHIQTIDPVTGQGEEDTITLTLNYAPVNEIKPQLRSTTDPGLAQDKLLARVTQLELENLTPQERTYLYQQQMVRLLDTSLATPLARSLLKRTGLVDELHVSRVINPAGASLPPDPSNPAGNQQDTVLSLLAGTKYTLAKRLSNRISLGYGLRFEEVQAADEANKLVNKLDLRSDVELSYRFLSNVYLRGTFDLPTTTPGALPDRRVTIEPRWRFGWWGHTNKPKPKSAVPPPTPPAPSVP